MKFVTGSLLDTDLPALGHGVNLQGLMGAGVAKAIRDKYPTMIPAYRLWCNTAQPGDAMLYVTPDDKIVCNLASQNLPGRDAKYGWLTLSTTYAMRALIHAGVYELALPRIGCGIGGLDWGAVSVILALLESSASNFFEFTIYTPEGQS